MIPFSTMSSSDRDDKIIIHMYKQIKPTRHIACHVRGVVLTSLATWLFFLGADDDQHVEG